MKTLVIVNPTANQGRILQILPQVEARLKELGIEATVRLSPSPTAPPEMARQGIAEGFQRIVAAGGDGTSHMVGGALAGTDAVVGFLPMGRGNDYAIALGIPRDPLAACEVLRSGEVTEVDIGRRMDGQIFVNMAGAGFDSEVNRYGNQVRWIKGGMVYYYAAIVQIFRFKAATFTLVHDQGTWKGKALMIGIGNSPQYGGGMLLTPHANLRDGLFDIVVVGDLGKIDFFRTLPKVFKGTHLENPKVSEFKTSRIEISCDAAYCSYADGDFFSDLPMTLEVVPRALRVLVPRDKPPALR
jgi:diacylglycerol kinase (ATP)